jgi:hypothetical protein
LRALKPGAGAFLALATVPHGTNSTRKKPVFFPLKSKLTVWLPFAVTKIALLGDETNAG